MLAALRSNDLLDALSSISRAVAVKRLPSEPAHCRMAVPLDQSAEAVRARLGAAKTNHASSASAFNVRYQRAAHAASK